MKQSLHLNIAARQLRQLGLEETIAELLLAYLTTFDCATARQLNHLLDKPCVAVGLHSLAQEVMCRLFESARLDEAGTPFGAPPLLTFTSAAQLINQAAGDESHLCSEVKRWLQDTLSTGYIHQLHTANRLTKAFSNQMPLPTIVSILDEEGEVSKGNLGVKRVIALAFEWTLYLCDEELIQMTGSEFLDYIMQMELPQIDGDSPAGIEIARDENGTGVE